jgi:CAAX prenyl protease-like protein
VYGTITGLRRHPAIPWVLPFAVFILMLAAQPYLHLSAPLRFAISMAAILVFSREPLRGRPSSPLLSILLGLAVFALWIGPDVLAPAWRKSFLFHNFLIAPPTDNVAAALKTDTVFLIFRIATSALAVPILEELFWRGWLMRWLIDGDDFRRVPLGKYVPMAFWVTAVLFAAEHGPFWDVGLLTGAIYNLWMVRTRNLWDCIIMHGMTNGALALYVLAAGQWQYWP